MLPGAKYCHMPPLRSWDILFPRYALFPDWATVANPLLSKRWYLLPSRQETVRLLAPRRPERCLFPNWTLLLCAETPQMCLYLIQSPSFSRSEGTFLIKGNWKSGGVLNLDRLHLLSVIATLNRPCPVWSYVTLCSQLSQGTAWLGWKVTSNLDVLICFILHLHKWFCWGRWRGNPGKATD